MHDPPPVDPFHGHVNESREHACAVRERCDPLDVVNPVLQHDDHGAGAALPGQPGPGLRCLLRLGGQQDPVHGPRRVGISDHRRGDRPLLAIEFQRDRPARSRPRADDHIRPGLLGGGSGGRADRARADDGDLWHRGSLPYSPRTRTNDSVRAGHGTHAVRLLIRT
ncbi:MAG TPA: hypothetical protein VMC83_40100 [Streptosporangiaceae bacterium]|nr:hypothetical protein [Streptosporangiaceae bacterium]